MVDRFGYEISDDMKKVWEVELDLLDQLVSVCEKYNLRYFLNGGTLLGAVRHHGFIPWDDDIDVMMLREDYDKLWEVADKEFSDPYFFQTALSEDNFFRTHAQLRNSNTTGFIDDDLGKGDINLGIFIDILPVDVLPKSEFELKLFRLLIMVHKFTLIYGCKTDMKDENLVGKLIYIYSHLVLKFVPYKKYFDFFNRHILAKYRDKDTGRVGDVTLKWLPGVHWKSEWFSDYLMMDFEDRQYRVPIGYDEILTCQYGDYMTVPKDVKNVHGNVTFDPDTPYKEWLRRRR